MFAFEVKILEGRIARGLARAPVKTFRVLRSAWQEYVEDFTKRFVAARLSKRWSDGAFQDDKLYRRSGDFLRGIEFKVYGSSVGTLLGRVGWWSNAKLARQAWVHEHGMEIVAKDRLMTIPLSAALTARGTAKKKRARDWANSFVLKTRDGRRFIVQKKGRGKKVKLTFLYVLKERVRIPARLGLNYAWRGDSRRRTRLLSTRLLKGFKDL